MNKYLMLFYITCFVVLFSRITECLHLKGKFNTNEFFRFLTRFGVQSTDMHDSYSTRGYIYGNITLTDQTQELNPNLLIMLTVTDFDYFKGYYNRRLILPRSSACPMMFENISNTAYFFECNENGKQDFVRKVPCPTNKLCIDEDKPDNVLNGFQFTFKIQDFNQARFWYISLVACNRDSCKWTSLAESKNISYTIKYDIWLVNGNPNSNYKNRFEHQFSYELHDIFEIYLCSFLIYFFIFPFIVLRLKNHFHKLYLILLIYVSIELTSRFLSLLHIFVFSFNGVGLKFLQFISDFLEAVASSVLILILIAVAKGWTVRSKLLKITKQTFLLWFLLQFVLVLSHMIALESIDPILNKNPYETIPGYIELGTRFLFMLWFLIELKETFKNIDSVNDMNEDYHRLENRTESGSDLESDYELEIENEQKNKKLIKNYSENKIKKLRIENCKKFYLHYGACSLVWFIYLPMLIFVTSFVSELFKLRLVLSIKYFVNFISVVVLFYIMWSPKTPLKLPGKKEKLKHEFKNFIDILDQEEDFINEF